MFGSQILDVVVGVAFVYLSLSMVCSGLGEIVAVLFHQRAKLLEGAVQRLLAQSDALLGDLKKHPLVDALRRPNDDRLPSYLPSRTFALALVDLARAWTKPADAAATTPMPNLVNKLFEGLKDGTLAAKEGAGKKVVDALALLAAEAKGDFDVFLKNVERWFDEAMDRLSGAYKKWSRYVLILVGFAIAVATNADSLQIATRLYRDTALRGAIVAMAEQKVVSPTPATPSSPPAPGTSSTVTPDAEIASRLAAIKENLDRLSPLLGWSAADSQLVRFEWSEWERDHPSSSAGRAFAEKFGGWAITAFALALGAPFWFDALEKLLKLRTSVKPAKSDAKPDGAKKPGA